MSARRLAFWVFAGWKREQWWIAFGLYTKDNPSNWVPGASQVEDFVQALAGVNGAFTPERRIVGDRMLEVQRYYQNHRGTEPGVGYAAVWPYDFFTPSAKTPAP